MLNSLFRIALLSVIVSYPVKCETDSKLDETSCAPCECVMVDRQARADCSNRNLENIPINLPPSIVEIYLDDNILDNSDKKDGICDIYKDLKRITLAQSRSQEFNSKAAISIFKGCESLEKIVLTGNRMASDSLDIVLPHLKGLLSLKGLSVTGPLKRGSFSPLKKLKYLELTYNELNFPVDLFADLPQLGKLHLNLVNVVEISDAALEINDLIELSLNGPKIMELPPSFFSNLDNLVTLDLELPQLSRLKWPEHHLFSSLKHLSLKRIWQVDASTLSGMTSLQTLQLSGIEDILVDMDMFAELGKLEVLDIISCQLKHLQSSWFSKLDSLYDLNLTDNKLGELDVDALNGLSKLQNIDLSYNKIVKIPQGFLNPVVENLENLSLNGNMLRSVKKEDFPLMKKLMALDVSKNSLSEFDLNISQQMPNLIYLQLQENLITNLTGYLSSKTQRVNVSDNLFESFPSGLLVESLIDLDISGSFISLPVDEIMNHENLKELTIRNMIVKCDCAMQNLIKTKTVHGGNCEGDDDNKVSYRNVYDILNELMCNENPLVTVSSNDTTVDPKNTFMQSTSPSNNANAPTEMDIPIKNNSFHNVTILVLNGNEDSNKTIKKVLNGVENITPFEDLRVTDLVNTTLSGAAVKDIEISTEVDSIETISQNLKWNVTKGKNKTDYKDELNTSKMSISKDNETSNAFIKDTPVEETANYKEQNQTRAQIVSKTSSSHYNASKTSVPSGKEHVKGTHKQETDVNIDLIVFPIVTILIIIVIVAVVLMVWHVRRTGSHNLDHDRRNITDRESEHCKMVMTELGKTHPGREVIIM